MVRNREIETEQADDGADQPFGLAQSQTEHSFDGQGRRDRQIRVVRLATRRGARLSVPGCDCVLGEPDRQAPALAQGSIVLGPVRDLVLLLGNVVAAVLVQLERQGRLPGIRSGAHLLRHPAPATNQPIRATRLGQGTSHYVQSREFGLKPARVWCWERGLRWHHLKTGGCRLPCSQNRTITPTISTGLSRRSLV